MIARDIMTPEPITANVRDSVKRVYAIMLDEDVRHVPIVEGVRLRGMISDRDLRSAALPALAEFDDPEHARALMNQTVVDYLSGDLLYVGAETDVSDIIDIMIDQKVGAVPVVDENDATLLGIISYVDVLRAARELF